MSCRKSECVKSGLRKHKNGRLVTQILPNLRPNKNNPREVERIKAFVTANGVSFRSQPTRSDKGPFLKVTGRDKYLHTGER